MPQGSPQHDTPRLSDYDVLVPEAVFLWLDAHWAKRFAKDLGHWTDDDTIVLAEMCRRINVNGEAAHNCAYHNEVMGTASRKRIRAVLRFCPAFILTRRYSRDHHADTFSYAPNLAGIAKALRDGGPRYSPVRAPASPRVPFRWHVRYIKQGRTWVRSREDGLGYSIRLPSHTRMRWYTLARALCERRGWSLRLHLGVVDPLSRLIHRALASVKVRGSGRDTHRCRLRAGQDHIVSWFRRGRLFHPLTSLRREARNRSLIMQDGQYEPVAVTDLNGTYLRLIASLGGEPGVAFGLWLNEEDIYRKMMRIVGDTDDRRAAKGRFMSQAIFWNGNFMSKELRPYYFALRTINPWFWKTLDGIRRQFRRTSQLSDLLMHMESKLFNHTIIPVLGQMGVVAYPVHDAIVHAESRMDIVKNVCELASKEFFGYTPRFDQTCAKARGLPQATTHLVPVFSRGV